MHEHFKPRRPPIAATARTLTPRRSVAAAVVLAALPSSLVAADGAIPVWEPTTITRPGAHVVTRDVVADLPDGTALIRIEAEGVDLDLNGFTLSVTSTAGCAADACAVLDIQAAGVSVHDGRIDVSQAAEVRPVVHSGDGARFERLTVVGADGAGHWLGLQGRHLHFEDNTLDAVRVVSTGDGAHFADNRIESAGVVALGLTGNRSILVRNTIRGANPAVLVRGPGHLVADNQVLGAAELHAQWTRFRDNTVVALGGTALTVGSVGTGNLIEGNLLGSGDGELALAFDAASSGNTYRRNVGPGSGVKLDDAGTGNVSSGDNYLPDLR